MREIMRGAGCPDPLLQREVDSCPGQILERSPDASSLMIGIFHAQAIAGVLALTKSGGAVPLGTPPLRVLAFERTPGAGDYERPPVPLPTPAASAAAAGPAAGVKVPGLAVAAAGGGGGGGGAPSGRTSPATERIGTSLMMDEVAVCSVAAQPATVARDDSVVGRGEGRRAPPPDAIHSFMSAMFIDPALDPYAATGARAAAGGAGATAAAASRRGAASVEEEEDEADDINSRHNVALGLFGIGAPEPGGPYAPPANADPAMAPIDSENGTFIIYLRDIPESQIDPRKKHPLIAAINSQMARRFGEVVPEAVSERGMRGVAAH